ncbi:GNAT family N-acetyltransferase [Roseomonas sp. CCTCC AB2023176]|uniref:GNAT family N-acetyltransferase n=1 Tax=Roseomonas sp. CCTCC AB2023176 TaxID=3342640 RepID=UPI0035E14AE8
MSEEAFRIVPAAAADLGDVRRLFEAYAGSLGVDLAYQGFAEELAGLPGKYAAPEGAMLVARDAGNAAIGCVALRGMAEPGCCEMKRLYVTPAGRGRGLGRALVEAVCAAAVRAGYREIRLDTLPDMTEAQALYARLGFVEVAPYYDTPVAGTRFMARRLGG